MSSAMSVAMFSKVIGRPSGPVPPWPWRSTPITLRSCGEELDVRAEHLDGAEAAVDQDQRVALAVGLVPDLDAVDVGVAGLGRGGQCGHLHGGLLGDSGEGSRDRDCRCGDEGEEGALEHDGSPLE